MNRRIVLRRLLLSGLCASTSLLCGCAQDVPADMSAGTAGQFPAAASAELKFVYGFDEGLAQAKAEGKPLLVFFTASWCTYCHQMETQAFRQSDVVELSKRFVCVLVDADEEVEVCRQFRVRGFPTVQFLSPRGVPLNRLVGKQPAQLLLQEMQTALLAVDQRRANGAESSVY